jgi:hypothetical protein
MPDKYDPTREITPAFIAQVSDWITASGEVLVILRYLRAAGSKDYVFCRSASDFQDLVTSLPVGTETIVFRNAQLPLRGICSEALVERSLAFIPDGTEYLIALLERTGGSTRQPTGSMGDNNECLAEDMACFRGKHVAVGPLPNFTAPDNDSMISASKGGIDGPR